MSPNNLLVPVLLPAILAAIAFILPKTAKSVRELILGIGATALLYYSWSLFNTGHFLDTRLVIPWADYIDLELRLYHFNGFILFWINVFAFLITLYSTIKMSSHPRIREYYGYLFLTVALANGAVLANNFLVLLFFWEGLLLTLYGLLTLGTTPTTQRTAVKALLINGVCDFCMILGIAILWIIAGKSRLSEVSVKPVGLAAVSFVLIMIGALGKGGAMPFHTWIPDAAIDAPVSVMAFLPGALEKLLGVFLLTKISLELFVLEPNSSLSIIMMVIGSITIVLAVLMALIQKDFKKLLSFHAISQYGYMVLGIGTALPLGIAGAVFHMLNNAIYKSGLFMSAGSVEHRAGTTELGKLGGLRKEMPLTALCYLVLAAAISGIWPLNGFVSKEMVIHGAYETGYLIFAIAAWVGAIFTFASFLKAGHSIFFGPRMRDTIKIKESESPFLIPMVILALVSILFGIYNKLPLKLFMAPIFNDHGYEAGHLDFSKHALDVFNPVALVSILMLLVALCIHFYGWNKADKKASRASEVIHHLPVLSRLYDWSEARVFDMYEQGIKFLRALSNLIFIVIDRSIDFFYERIVTATGQAFTTLLRYAHNGHYANYLAWCIAGLVLIVYALVALLK